MPPGRVKILVPDVSVEMRAAVDAAAREQDVSRNQVAVDALIARYGLPPALGDTEDRIGYRPSEGNSSGSWSVEVPVRVRAALRLEAARKGATISGLVRATLAEKFGLPVEDAKRKPRSSK